MPASDQKVSTGRYSLIPRTLIFLVDERPPENRVLLLRGAAHKRLWAGLYNGVGGHVERGEDVLSSARRELLEETGYTAPRLWLAGVVTIDAAPDLGVCVFVLRGAAARPDDAPRPSREGLLEWVPVTRLAGLPAVEDLPTLLPRVLDARPDGPPFFAHYRYDPQGNLLITFASEG